LRGIDPGSSCIHAIPAPHLMGVAMLLASNWGNGQVLLAMLEFFVFVIWIWLLIVVF
jgi:hypothetical protein